MTALTYDPMMIITIPQAARAARVPVRDLRRAIDSGQVPVVRLSARKTFVDLRYVLAWHLAT